MRSTLILTFLVSIAFSSGAARKFLKPNFAAVDSPKYETTFFDAFIDNFDPTLTDKFPVKYLVNKDFYVDDGTNPLFFYTGNEGTIETFAANTGIIYDIAPQFNALIVFCEHRYYGNGSSLPFGTQSFANVSTAKYLTVEQALGDFAHLIDNLRSDYNFTKVIAFGGSYGGMLSAWFRVKYPHVVDGAWAASAPVAYFRNSPVPMSGFDRIVSKTMIRFGCNQDAVANALKQLNSCTFNFLNRLFNTDTRSKITSQDDIDYLKSYIREGFEYMAMTCYPYPANFLRPLGPWPMLSACTNLSSTFDRPQDAAKALKLAMDAFYDPKKPACFKPGCGDSATAGLGDLYGWSWQSCTEIPIDICAEGPPIDPFWLDCTKKKVLNSVPTFEEYFSNDCANLNSTIIGYDPEMIQYDFIQRFYGFDLAGGSNMILTQGFLDPWSAGGAIIDPLTSPSRNVFMYLIDGAAHHLDLRVPNTCDPPTVTNARYQIVNILKCWTGQRTDGCDQPYTLQWDLPDWKGPEIRTDCAALTNQYPWGQETSSQTTQLTPKTGKPGTGSTASVKPGGSKATTQSPQHTTAGAASNFGVFSVLLLVFLSIRFM